MGSPGGLPRLRASDLALSIYQVVCATLVVFALLNALILTYGFLPYNDLGNGFLACWFSLLATVWLARLGGPQLASSESSDGSHRAGLPVANTVHDDDLRASSATEITSVTAEWPRDSAVVQLHEGAEPAEMPPGDERASASLIGSASRPSKPPVLLWLCLACFLVIVAAAHRMGGGDEYRRAGVPDGLKSTDKDAPPSDEELAGVEAEGALAISVASITLVMVLGRVLLDGYGLSPSPNRLPPSPTISHHLPPPPTAFQRLPTPPTAFQRLPPGTGSAAAAQPTPTPLPPPSSASWSRSSA